MTITWKEQYQHPLWQKKRLEAMEHAEFTCDGCGDGESQLHVHHRHYVKGRKIWEYELRELSVLCGPCHEMQHAEKDRFFQLLTGVPAAINPMRDVTALVAGFYCGLWRVGEVVDVEQIRDDAKYQYMVGAIAGALMWDQPIGGASERILRFCENMMARQEVWDAVKVGVEFLADIESRRVLGPGDKET